MVLVKMSKQIALAYMAIVVLAISLVTPASAGVTLQDSTGRTISITETPRRIVSLSPSITETLAYLGGLDTVVGADSLSLSDEWFNISTILRARNVTDVGGYWWSAIRSEEILAASPDLVLAEKGAHIPLLDFFKNYNVTVVYLEGGASRSIQDVLSDMYTVALILNKTSLLAEFSGKLEAEFQKYRELVAERYKGVSILFVIDLTGGIWVAGKGTYIDDIVERLGLVNACRDIYSWTSISLEKAVELNPDVIVVASMGGINISIRLLDESGLTRLGKPIVVLNQSETDILMRPGPLLLYAPQVVYNALSRANITGGAAESGSQGMTLNGLLAATVVIVAAVIVAVVVLVVFKRR